jgi:hypothetical protein
VAAERVELEPPEVYVRGGPGGAAASGCCGGVGLLCADETATCRLVRTTYGEHRRSCAAAAAEVEGGHRSNA